MDIFLNVALGLLPTFALAWTIAADAKKPDSERVVAGAEDAFHQRRIFLLIQMLWALTLLMWNWMRETHPAWAVIWGVVAVVSGAMLYRLRRAHAKQ